MGLYDIVIIRCPECGEKEEIQSKGADNPSLNKYYIHNVPLDVLIDINLKRICQKCNTGYTIKIDYTVTVIKNFDPEKYKEFLYDQYTSGRY